MLGLLMPVSANVRMCECIHDAALQAQHQRIAQACCKPSLSPCSGLWVLSRPARPPLFSGVLLHALTFAFMLPYQF